MTVPQRVDRLSSGSPKKEKKKKKKKKKKGEGERNEKGW